MLRLETVDKNLLEKLKLASQERQKAAAIAACEFAFERVLLHAPIVLECLGLMRNGTEFSNGKILELNQLANELDDKYFNFQDGYDGVGLAVGALQFFSQARAVSALSLVGRESSFISSAEAVYEALSAVDDGVGMIELLVLILSER